MSDDRKPNQPVDQPDGRARSGVSRRSFLRGGAASAVLGGALLDADPAAARRSESEAEDAAAVVGPGPVALELTVNGNVRRLRLEPRVTLLDALRDHLDVTGPKRVCDRATCGACTVLEDGEPIYSCTRLAIEAQGREVTTVEALGTPTEMHPIQAAFVENDAQQCGFCTPGFVVACEALLREHPAPTEDQLRSALGGNLCRCGTYAGIRRVVTGGSAADVAAEEA